jgi:predicted NACHT family NTPase
LEFDLNSPGSVFALNRSGLMNKISEIVSDFKDITFTDQAGIKELQIKNKPDSFTILDLYYGK